MKKLLVAFAIFGSLIANAQSADEIIAKSAAAVGGLDKFNAIKTATMSGVMTVQGMDLNISLQMINKKAVRTDIEVMGQSVTVVYNDGAGWQLNPMTGNNEATDLPKEALEEAKWQCYVSNGLIDYKERGMSAEYKGEETVDGKKMFVIKLSSADGRNNTYYVNQADYLVYKTIAKRNVMGQDVEAETVYSNYKEYNGVKVATTRATNFEGQTVQEMNFDKIEFDKPIDASVFKKA
jgi:hypothetical protein